MVSVAWEKGQVKVLPPRVLVPNDDGAEACDSRSGASNSLLQLQGVPERHNHAAIPVHVRRNFKDNGKFGLHR